LGILQTLSRLLSGKWSSIGSRHSWWSMCIPTKKLCHYRKCGCPIPFVYVMLAISDVWSSVSPYLVQSHYRHRNLLVPVIFHPRDLVTCCNIGWILPSGPRVPFHNAEEQIPLLMHTPQHTPLETQETPFQSPYYRVTVDAIKASSGSSD
jgi:hypothetical protein